MNTKQKIFILVGIGLATFTTGLVLVSVKLVGLGLFLIFAPLFTKMYKLLGD